MRLSRERIGASGNMDVDGARRAIGPGLRPGLRRSSVAGTAVRCRQNFGQIKSELRSNAVRFCSHDQTIKPKHTKKGRGYAHKHKVLALVDRNTGRAKSMVVDDLKAKTLVPILKENISKEATVYTDEAGQYRRMDREFADHAFVRHGAGEWGRGPIHTNTIEGYFSIFKRGMKGVYQHCAKKHLHRYAAEFEFRYNHRTANGFGDVRRSESVLSSAQRKRLTYRGSSVAA